MSLKNSAVERDLAELAAVAPLDGATGSSVRISLSATSSVTQAVANAILATGGASSAALQTITGAALNGAVGTGTMNPPRRGQMTFSSHANWTGGTATWTGKDVNGQTVTDTFTIPAGGNATVTGALGTYFASVTSIAIPAQGGASGTFTAGYTAHIAPGYYEVVLDKTGGVAILCWGPTAVIPSAGVSTPAGTMAVRDGDVVRAPGGTACSGILTGAGTGECFLNPLVAA